MSSTNSPPRSMHWVHEPIHTFVDRVARSRAPNTPSPTSLEVQVFITHQQTHILLFKLKDANAWTVPSVNIPTNHPRPLREIGLEILQHAIEERTLPDLQFTDHGYQLTELEFDPSVRRKALVKMILSTAEPRTEEGTSVRCEHKFQDVMWFDINATGQTVKLRNVSKAKLEDVKARNRYAQDQIKRAFGEPGRDLKVLYEHVIKSAVVLKAIDRGEEIEYVFLARSIVNRDVLCLMVASMAMLREATEEDHWQIRNRVAVTGGNGAFETNVYNIVGWVEGDRVTFSEVQISRGMMLEHSRVAIDWIQETRQTVLAPGQAPVLPDGWVISA